MIILGIDPGTAKTGFGVVKKQGKKILCLDFGVIETSKDDLPQKRLKKIYCQMLKLLKAYQPEVMVVENLFFFKNLKTVMPVSEAKGVILLAAGQKKVPVEQLTPLQVKMAVCGYGRADKKQIQKMIQQALSLEDLPRPDDAADALALAVCWAQSGAAKKALTL